MCAYPSSLSFISNLKTRIAISCFWKNFYPKILIFGFFHQNNLPNIKFLLTEIGNFSRSRRNFHLTGSKPPFFCKFMIHNAPEAGFTNYCHDPHPQIRFSRAKPDPNTLHLLLASCSSVSDCLRVHCQFVKLGFYSTADLGDCLASIYARSGLVVDARKVFDEMPHPKNPAIWTLMVSACVQSGSYEAALGFFRIMRQTAEVKISRVSVAKALHACARLKDLREGREIHDYMVKANFEVDDFVQTSLIDMYAKCGSLAISFKLFQGLIHKDLVSWNTIISGFVQSGNMHGGLILFNQMRLTTRFAPSEVSLVSVLPALTDLGSLNGVQSIHSYIVKAGFRYHVKVLNSLLTMYGRCNSLGSACQLFMDMEIRNLVSWNSMVAIHTQNGFAEDAIDLFIEMKRSDIKPDRATIVSILRASSNLAAAKHCKAVHGYVISSGFSSDMHITTALINSYSKSGILDTARKIFNEMNSPDVVAWTAMLAGYAMHGYGREAIDHLDRMVHFGIKPDHVTFTHILSACSHSGLVREGRMYFERMRKNYRLEARVDHYSCMVDLLGRSGLLDEAHELIKSMEIEPNAGVWGALLGACRMHYCIELGERVAKKLIMLEPLDPRNYVILSNMYSAAGKWNDASKVRALMKARGLRKDRACSSIEFGNKIHTFVVGDWSHPQSEEIYARLGVLTEKMREMGYVPLTKFVLHDVDEETKGDMINQHSEKLAIAFGLLVMNDGVTIVITKNLRICGDCHNAAKFISAIEKRVIVIRDSKRFHHFVNGSCSCGDYW